jgi:tetratricopeptide (TPR) repeat protein
MIIQRLRKNWMLPLIVVLGALLISLVMQLPRAPKAPGPVDAEAMAELQTELPVDPVAAAVEKVSGPNPMEGVQALLAMTRGDSPNVDAVIALGRLSIQSGQMDKAQERFEQAIELAPERIDPYVQLGMLELDEDRPADALLHFEQAVALDSTYTNALFFMAQSHERLSSPELALDFYARCIIYATDTAVVAGVEQRMALLQSHINS